MQIVLFPKWMSWNVSFATLKLSVCFKSLSTFWHLLCAWGSRLLEYLSSGHWFQSGISLHPLSLAELLLFWYLGDDFTWKYNKNKCEPSIALFIFSRLKRSSLMIYPASYLWTHAVITAFSSFCAFKLKFQFCTNETLKIANADWYVLS